MKCLSLQQPWAWMLVHGFDGKTIENREWATNYRGPVLIHASMKFDAASIPWIAENISAAHIGGFAHIRAAYDFGCIVGVARLVDIVTESENKWFVGPYGWHFDRARELSEPIPLKGQLGLFDVHEAIERQVRAAFERRVSA